MVSVRNDINTLLSRRNVIVRNKRKLLNLDSSYIWFELLTDWVERVVVITDVDVIFRQNSFSSAIIRIEIQYTVMVSLF